MWLEWHKISLHVSTSSAYLKRCTKQLELWRCICLLGEFQKNIVIDGIHSIIAQTMIERSYHLLYSTISIHSTKSFRHHFERADQSIHINMEESTIHAICCGAGWRWHRFKWDQNHRSSQKNDSAIFIWRNIFKTETKLVFSIRYVLYFNKFEIGIGWFIFAYHLSSIFHSNSNKTINTFYDWFDNSAGEYLAICTSTSAQ